MAASITRPRRSIGRGGSGSSRITRRSRISTVPLRWNVASFSCPRSPALGCPHWDRSAAGTFLGLGIDTTGREMARAVLEGVALRAAEIMRAMGGLLPLADTISIDGGLSRNGYFCRFLARVLGREVRVFEGEAAALGAALMAAEGLGGVQGAPQTEGRRYASGQPLAEADLARFAEAIRRAQNWR